MEFRMKPSNVGAGREFLNPETGEPMGGRVFVVGDNQDTFVLGPFTDDEWEKFTAFARDPAAAAAREQIVEASRVTPPGLPLQ